MATQLWGLWGALSYAVPPTNNERLVWRYLFSNETLKVCMLVRLKSNAPTI